MGALDEVAEHRLGDLEVGDHAVLDRADRADVAGRASEHLLRLEADREHALAPPVLRHRILPNYRAEAEGIGLAEIIDHLLEKVPSTIGK